MRTLVGLFLVAACGGGARGPGGEPAALDHAARDVAALDHAAR